MGTLNSSIRKVEKEEGKGEKGIQKWACILMTILVVYLFSCSRGKKTFSFSYFLKKCMGRSLYDAFEVKKRIFPRCDRIIIEEKISRCIRHVYNIRRNPIVYRRAVEYLRGACVHVIVGTRNSCTFAPIAVEYEISPWVSRTFSSS